MKITILLEEAANLTGGNRGNGDGKHDLCSLRFLLFNSALLLSFANTAPAGVHYVDLNSTNATPPYTNWATAATNIQDAVDAAVGGDEVVVTNGTYATGGRNGNRVVVDNALNIRSVNGPQSVAIQGDFGVRCVYLTNGAALSGFTLINGWSDSGGGAYGGILSNCTLSGNGAVSGGGAYGSTLSNCTLSGNVAVWTVTIDYGYFDLYARGGGAYNCTLNNCTLSGNSANAFFDGVAGDSYAYAEGGGAFGCTLNNCTLSGNSSGATNYATFYDGIDPLKHAYAYGGGTYDCALTNCALSGNSAFAITYGWYSDAGAAGGGSYGGTQNNCISFGNTRGSYSWVSFEVSACEDCPSPPRLLPRNNWRGDPLFVDTNGWANLRLQSNSPCINAGNDAFAPVGPDLDGNPRIVGGAVDIGAYEFQAPVSKISYAWLYQHGLPINDSTDSADPDADGVDNYHEWLAGSDPTNPFSFPPLLTLIPYGPNVILTWPTNAVGFTLQSATELTPSALWSTNLPGPVVIGGQNVVTNPISGPHEFYRLIH